MLSQHVKQKVTWPSVRAGRGRVPLAYSTQIAARYDPMVKSSRERNMLCIKMSRTLYPNYMHNGDHSDRRDYLNTIAPESTFSKVLEKSEEFFDSLTKNSASLRFRDSRPQILNSK